MAQDENKSLKSTRDISNELEEDNFWDLEDDWEDAPQEKKTTANESDDTSDQSPETTPEETTSDDTSVDNTQDEKVTDQGKQENPSSEEEPENHAPEEDFFESEEVDDDFELENPILDEETDSTADTELTEPTQTAETETESDQQTASEEAPVSKSSEATPAAKKSALNGIEKICLALIATCFLGLTIWGIIWLQNKNKIADTRETVDMPQKGTYATLTELSTFWVTPDKNSGVNLNAVIVPALSLTLDPDTSESGALRLYFRNADKSAIGDTITLEFSGGKFTSNGSSTIEVSASDGFHQEGKFREYQIDTGVPWRVIILEAPSTESPGSEFKALLDAPVSGRRK